MKEFGKIISSFFFVIFFLLFLIVATVRLEVLNKSFVFSSLERNNVYQKLPEELSNSILNDPNMSYEEKIIYSKMISLASPNAVRNLLEKNLSGVLDFVNGSSREFIISASGKDLGINGADINWSVNRNATPDMVNIFQIINGIGNTLLIIGFVLLILLILFYIPAGTILFLISGIISMLLGVLGKIFLYIIVANTSVRDPAQVLLILLSGSIFSDIAISWIILGVVIIVLWIFLRIKSNKNT